MREIDWVVDDERDRLSCYSWWWMGFDEEWVKNIRLKILGWV